MQKNNIYYKEFGIEPFLEYHKIKYSHKKYLDLSNEIKKMPDFIVIDNNDLKFIECKSSGVDEDLNYVLRIKEQDINGYFEWNKFKNVLIFVTYNYNKEFFLITLIDLINEMKKVKAKQYNDNKLKYRTLYINQLIKHKL